MVATPAFALLTITNVHLYARESWVAVGARLTKNYLGRIETLLQETGRSSFYVTNGGDPHFFWHVDGGAALPFVLGQNATFRFARDAYEFAVFIEASLFSTPCCTCGAVAAAGHYGAERLAMVGRFASMSGVPVTIQ